MPDVTDEELAAALKAAEDENGVDQRLAQATAAMTPEQRRLSEESIRRWIEAARRGREAEHLGRWKDEWRFLVEGWQQRGLQ